MKSRYPNDRQEIGTSLEIPLFREGDTLRIDLTHLWIFFGLSILSNDIGEKTISRHDLDRIDIEVEKKVKRPETPELAALQVENIKVTGDYEVFEKILADKAAFHEDLRTVFGTLQMERWRKHLFPTDTEAVSSALVFERRRILQDEEYPFRVILERLRSAKKADKHFLRATFEGQDGRRLDLASFPHVRVENPEGRTFIAGSTRISQILCDQVRWEAQRGKRAYSEVLRTESYIFNRLAHAGLDKLVALELTWSERYIDRFRAMEPDQLKGIFKKILLLLEDHTVRRLLEQGETIRIDFGMNFANLDLSQLGRSLNISFGHSRRTSTIDEYLRRMPLVEKCIATLAETPPLKGVKVFLVHHITAEILAFIAALRDLGVEDVATLFVHYGEEVPSDFLEALLDLDQERFTYYCLNKIDEPLSVEGYFVLSPRFSALDGLESLERRLFGEKPRYFNAMVQTATHIFLRVLLGAIQENRKCLIVEDGGYITPLITERALQGCRLGDLLTETYVPPIDGMSEIAALPLDEVLDRWLIGTVEHTKNGLVRLAELLHDHNKLARPAFSIAISNLKVTEEAREVAASILSAVESVLHAQGKVLSQRRVLIMGSEGSIGRNLVAQLTAGRLSSALPHPLEVDLRNPEDLSPERHSTFATRFRDLPHEQSLEVDLIIGVTGLSAFLWEDMELLLLEGRPTTFYLASGSTKTIEFEAVSLGIERLLKTRTPSIRGIPCRIEGKEIADPQTGRILGHKYCFFLDADAVPHGMDTYKEIAFLGSLMPINFLYYGVPGEIMDAVLSQLLRCTIGLVRRAASQDPPGKTLYAVDHEIDTDGEMLGSA